MKLKIKALMFFLIMINSTVTVFAENTKIKPVYKIGKQLKFFSIESREDKLKKFTDVYETEHFVVRTTLIDCAKDVAEHLELFFSQTKSLFPNKEMKTKTHVMIASPDEFLSWFNFDRSKCRWSGVSFGNQALARHLSDGKVDIRVIQHEVIHTLQNSYQLNCRNKFVVEGMATLLEIWNIEESYENNISIIKKKKLNEAWCNRFYEKRSSVYKAYKKYFNAIENIKTGKIKISKKRKKYIEYKFKKLTRMFSKYDWVSVTDLLKNKTFVTYKTSYTQGSILMSYALLTKEGRDKYYDFIWKCEDSKKFTDKIAIQFDNDFHRYWKANR